MEATELIQVIQESANEVYRHLRGGYEETIYEEAMAVEMRLRGLSYEVERTTEVFYKAQKVGTHRLDFVVAGEVVVELKAVANISKSHVAQLSAYLQTLGLSTGLIINFPYPDQEEPDCEIVKRS
jgi:GxxExxY protein